MKQRIQLQYSEQMIAMQQHSMAMNEMHRRQQIMAMEMERNAMIR